MTVKNVTNRFKKVLVANRGECAIRIIRACRRMGIESVAVYSNIDRRSLHVLLAEDAYKIGPAPSKYSYLSAKKILNAAIKMNVDAIHPGWGFLSENAQFARAVRDAGMDFIGPTPENIEAMGDKINAKTTMKTAGVPVVPGSDGAVSSLEEARAICETIGLPVLIKAVAGGGGRGMRVVRKLDDLPSAFRACKSEAINYFGNDAIYIEKFIDSPKHIEIQIFGDKYGNVVHLFDRECSVQRRNQKIIEECPSSTINDEIRLKMGEVSVTAAKAIGYVGAGTFEYIFDNVTKEFYFMEMNTRLQVEHTITEMVTGIDIVEEQISVAAGNPLGFTQEDVKLHGNAIEARVCAEDPITYQPSPGTIRICWQPQGPFIRVDSGVYSDYEVPIYYDPLIAKVCAWGHSREEAIQRLQRALTEFILTGVKSNIPLHKTILDHPKFLDASYTTQFVETEIAGNPQNLFRYQDDHVFLISAAISAYNERKNKHVSHFQTSSRWKNSSRQEVLRDNT